MTGTKTCLSFLCIDNSFVNYLYSYTMYTIHPLHPLHLVGGFELFGDSFFFGVFFYEPRKEILCLLFDVCEVGMEPTGSEKIVIQDFAMVL